jgi:hypothetical protein
LKKSFNAPALPTTNTEIVEKMPYDNLSINDASNPWAIINICPDWMVQSISKLPQNALDMNFESLKLQAKPTALEDRLRLSFWNEYFRVINKNEPTKLNINNIIGGVCSEEAFKKLSQVSKYKFIYIITPPPSLDLALEEIIHLGFSEMRKIMEFDLVRPDGTIDSKLAQVKYKIFTDTITKRHGHKSAHHITSKSVHANIHKTLPAEPEKPLSAAEMEEVLALNNPPINPNERQVIDIESTDDDELEEV